MCLLDTHTLLCFLFDDSKLSEAGLRLISQSDKAFVSVASLWEIAIKQSIGKIEIRSSISEIAQHCDKADINIRNTLLFLTAHKNK